MQKIQSGNLNLNFISDCQMDTSISKSSGNWRSKWLNLWHGSKSHVLSRKMRKLFITFKPHQFLMNAHWHWHHLNVNRQKIITRKIITNILKMRFINKLPTHRNWWWPKIDTLSIFSMWLNVLLTYLLKSLYFIFNSYWVNVVFSSSLQIGSDNFRLLNTHTQKKIVGSVWKQRREVIEFVNHCQYFLSKFGNKFHTSLFR